MAGKGGHVFGRCFFFSFSIEQVKDFMSVIRILTIFNAVISYKDFPPVISYKAFKPAT